MRNRRALRLLGLLLVASVALVACGSDSSSSDTSTTTPEEHRASDAEVAKGLHEIDDLAQQIAAASTRVKAVSLDEGIEPVWKTIEGTVKANDQDTYITFEDAFAVLGNGAKDGAKDKTAAAAKDISAAVAAYLAKHPG